MMKTENTKLSLLTPFVSTDKKRPRLHYPSRFGDWIIATDGRILVAIPDDGSYDVEPWFSEECGPLDDALEDGEPVEFDFSQVRERKIERVKCDCYGGEIECQTCLNWGPCENCDGSGYREDTENLPSVEIEGRNFAQVFVAKIKELPGAGFISARPTHKRLGRPNPINFTFDDGGRGILMPMREATK